MHQLLIVDDQVDLADDLALMLPWQDVGIDRVYKAYSAQEALEIMQTEPVDVVITDIKMPGMSGLELVERIRNSWRDVKIILLSGYADFDYARTALAHQASDYLLKPAADEELLEAVQKAVTELEEQWREISSTRKALRSLEENMPILRKTLLDDLLYNRRLRQEEIARKLEVLRLPFSDRQPVSMMMIRLEDYFDQYDQQDIELIEYAVVNMAEEIFAEEFHLWQTKDVHDYLVLLIQPSDHEGLATDRNKGDGTNGYGGDKMDGDRHTGDDEGNLLARIERKTAMLQHYVKLYLRGTISAIIYDSGVFPDDLSAMYDTLLVQFQRQIGSERELLITSSYESSRGTAKHLSQLYEPPQLMHLLEAGQWDTLRDKLNVVFEELEHNWGDSHEHILEVYYAIVSAISYAVHKKKQWLSDLLSDDYEKLASGMHFHTIAQLRDWTWKVIERCEGAAVNDRRDTRQEVIHQVQQYVADNLAQATLQTIASHVYLNPSYLSKIYKLETGEGISEFIFRLRMERAAHLLQTTNLRVYEVAEQLGYQKTSYFIKLFKDKYNCTPQEYKELVGL